MKKLLLLSVSLLIISSHQTHAQEQSEKFGISFKGFVKNDFFWDTRQVTTAREGHFLLWPAPVLPDANGVDINAQPSFNFLSVQSRLSGAITGPDAFGAKTSGLLEGDFFAQQNDNINLFRLRHALIRLNWEHTELLTGQYWNPLFVTGCFPGTISFNTGTPLQSFSRNPQIRITQQIGRISIIAAALAQRDFSSRGPDPNDPDVTAVSSEYLRNAHVPDMHVQVHFSYTDGQGIVENLLVGSGVAYKNIVPRLKSDWLFNTYAVDEKVHGITAILFTKIVTAPVTGKLQGRYGENIPDILSLSGFAVKEIVDFTTGEQSYTPLRNLSAWGEIHTNGSKIQAGLFAGVTKNIGTKEPMSSPNNRVYGLGTNIESLIRIAPRLQVISGRARIGAEIEFTGARYGADYDVNYIAGEVVEVTNTRLLMSMMYSF
jgi:hypothetical protein